MRDILREKVGVKVAHMHYAVDTLGFVSQSDRPPSRNLTATTESVNIPSMTIQGRLIFWYMRVVPYFQDLP